MASSRQQCMLGVLGHACNYRTQPNQHSSSEGWTTDSLECCMLLLLLLLLPVCCDQDSIQ
jgi:hypothetical protein